MQLSRGWWEVSEVLQCSSSRKALLSFLINIFCEQTELSGGGAAHTQVGRIPSPFRCDQCYQLSSVGPISSSALCQTGPWWGQGVSEALMLMYAGTWSICAHFAACLHCCAAPLNCCIRQLGSTPSPPAFGMGCMNPMERRGEIGSLSSQKRGQH